MPRNISSTQPDGPLSVGNIVSAGLRLYRDRFQSYFNLALIGYLWMLIPIYGWAKLAAITGLISRLAFSEINEHPETVKEARDRVYPKMWSFLWAGCLLFFIYVGATIGLFIFYIVVGAIVALIVGVLAQTSEIVAGILSFLVGASAIIASIFAFIWLLSRLFIVELPLAMEDNVTADLAIGRSWQLTKGFVLRLQGIVFVAFLITLPISIVVQIASSIVQLVLPTLFPPDSALFQLLYLVLVLGMSIASGALVLPFWQTIKAVIYYDLRSRREGLGLKFKQRDRT